MLNNNLYLIGVAVTNWWKDEAGKTATFKLELTKQKKGEVYGFEIKAFANSRSINLNENIKGKIIAVMGYLDEKKDIIATNAMLLSEKSSAPASVSEVPVVTSKDLEDMEITDDDLPF